MRLVVVGTNVVVSAFLSPRGSPARLLAMWERRDLALVVSEPLLAEYRRALLYERVAEHHGIDATHIEEVIAGFRRVATLVEIEHIPRVVESDPDDDAVIATAVAGHASYVTTGDRDLLRMAEHQGIPIVDLATFLSLFGTEGGS